MGKPMEKFVGTKLSGGLYERLQEYKKEMAIYSDSEALRDILRRFLFEVWKNGDRKDISELEEVTA